MTHNLFPVVILAGGLATRLHPLTETTPKSLIKIHGEPFISHQLRLLRKNNFKQIILCVGHLGEQIIEYVGDGSIFDLKVTYSLDGPSLLGTAGAIKQALPFLNDSFFVLYGDSYLPCDYSAIQNTYIASGKWALMSVYHNNGRWDTSNVECINKYIIAYDKINRTERMHYIDYGLGIFNRTAFEIVPSETHYDLTGLYQQLLHRKQLAAFEVKQRFYEVGSFAGIKELERCIISMAL